MQIKQVKVGKLYGIFTKKVSFHSDFTFIHGINGSGKTSLIKAMEALLTPDLEWIVNAQYSYIQIILEHENKKYTFKFSKIENTIILRQRTGNVYIEEKYDISSIKLLMDNNERHLRPSQGAVESIRSVIFQIFSNSEIIKKVQSIPTPMFLGLNRTAFLDHEFGGEYTDRRIRTPLQIAQDLGGDTLDKSITMALRLIHRSARMILQSQKLLEDELRTKITFLLFTGSSAQRRLNFDIPTNRDLSKYRRIRKEISETLIKLGFAKDNINSFVDPFFDALISNARLLIPYLTIKEALEKAANDTKLSSAITSWFDSVPILGLIDKYFEIVESFNRKIQGLRAEIGQFELIVNKFFKDSNKLLLVNGTGDVQIRQGEKYFDVAKLSSGEKQIFILISQLTFNPSLKKANVLIIDEPEISLHIKWQEIFVDGIREANPNTQLILATHSPSIVLDRIEKMVDLNAA